MFLKRNIHYSNPNLSISTRPKNKSCRSIPSSFKSLDKNQNNISVNNHIFIDQKEDIYISKDIDVENKLYNINSIDTKCYSNTLNHKCPGLDMEELHPTSHSNYFDHNIVLSLCNKNKDSVIIDNSNPNIYEKPILFTDFIENCPNIQVGPSRNNHGIEKIWDNPTKRKSIYK